MTLSTRDRRALSMLALSGVLSLVYYLLTPSDDAPVAPAAKVVASQSVEQAEQRLARLRDIAAALPAKEAAFKTVSAELATREKGLLVADTAAQAQAKLLQMIRSLASAEVPPVEVRSVEIGSVAPYGDSYGSVNVSLQVECRIEQLINLLAAVGSQPELVAPSDLRILSSSPKDKSLGVRLTLTALVPRKLLPEKKGGPL